MTFRGWPAEALEFFEGLEADNSKSYWQQNKDVYEELVRGPMGELLEELAPEWGEGKILPALPGHPFQLRQVSVQDVHCSPRRRQLYVQLNARGLGAGSGMWEMAKDQLERYRAAVSEDASGGELTE